MRVGLFTAAVAAGFSLGEAAADHRIYVTNEMSGDLTVIDGATREVLETLPLGKRPRGIQVAPDGRALYVALSGSPISPPGVDERTLPPPDKSADGIGVFSLEDSRVERVITGVSDPEQLAIVGERLFIASEDTGTAVIVSARDGAPLATLPVGEEPEGVAASPDGGVVYMTSESASTVAVIDAENLGLEARFEVGERPRAIAFSPDGSRAYVTGELDASLSVVDVATHTVTDRVTLPGRDVRPMGVAVSGDGAKIYVATGRGRTLVAIDAATLEIDGEVEVGDRPWGVALSPDGRFAYTANGPSDDVTVVDTESLEVVARIPVGTRPWGVAVVPAR